MIIFACSLFAIFTDPKPDSASLGRILVSVAVKRTKADGVSTENLRYYYVKNLQGYIVGMADESGVLCVNYTYDAWGKLTSITDGSGNTLTDKSVIGLLNPLRYRGYVYDTDTGLYYLQSRYYDPVTGRFLNADDAGILQLAQGEILGTNLFAYCGNNPVNHSDPIGNWGLPSPATIIAGAVIGGILSAVIEVAIQMLIFRKPIGKVNWGDVAIEFVTGAVIGGLIACNLPAGWTTLGRGITSMLSYLAYSIKGGKFKTLKGAATAIGSAVISGAVTMIIGRVLQKYGRTLNYNSVRQMLTKITINRFLRAPIRISVGFIKIVIN